jgi:hypothetical protein
LALIGKVLFFFALGSIYSITLIKYGYYFLIATVFFLINYLINDFQYWLKKRKISWLNRYIGFFGLIFLVIIFGMQSSHVPFKIYILSIGVLLILPAMYNLIKRKK